MHAEDKHRKLRVGPSQFLEGFEAVAARHRDVQHDDIYVAFAHEIQHIITIASFANDIDLRIAVQYLFQAVTYDRMIIGYKYFDHPI